MRTNESIKNQVKELVQEMILEALENGDALSAIMEAKESVKVGFNEALDESGATDNGFVSWKIKR